MYKVNRKIKVGTQEIEVDSSILEFGETNLNEFLQKVGGYHAYYAERSAEAAWILGIYEQKYDEIYSKKLSSLKNSNTVPVAQAAAKADEDVMNAHSQVLEARFNRDFLNGFLKSIDKAFQAAMNYGYNRRKEMDKLNHDIHELGDDPNGRLAEVLARDSVDNN